MHWARVRIQEIDEYRTTAIVAYPTTHKIDPYSTALAHIVQYRTREIVLYPTIVVVRYRLR